MKRPAFRASRINESLIGILILIVSASLSLANDPSPLPVLEQNSVVSFIHKRCQYLEQFKTVPVCSTCVASEITIPKFYMDRGYVPAWTDKKLIDQIIQAVENSYEHGLNPEDYHRKTIRMLIDLSDQGKATPLDKADLDILLTDALLRLSFHLYYGKVSPESLDPNWNLKRKILDKDPAQYLKRVISSGDITGNLDRLWPHEPYYLVLRAWLKKYRKFAQNPWQSLDLSRVLKLGMKGKDVALLRKRLAAEEFLQEQQPAHPELFDRSLEKAVKAFQTHHGLEPDGVVGQKTLMALNIKPTSKVNKIRVNLERARWVLHDLPKRFLLVNIAAFKLFYFENGQKKWWCKVMVGKPFWETPVFKATMEYVVLNPYWVVPPGILEKEVIPRIKRDPSYLSKKNMEIVDAKGRRIDPKSINWHKINPAKFPYIVRQRPGPKNALGRIKFIFPNKHFVFLHDTPAKSLFSKNIRAFSHGCIRVEKPMELAQILFKGSKKWTIEKIKKIIDSGRNFTIHLQKKIPIFILYWTVTRNEDDTITFLQDIYNRDKKILLGLDSPFKVSYLELPATQNLI